jgi:hypothetical protein
MELTDQILDKALGLVGEILAARKRDYFHLVVCGGSALIANKIVSRATHDVDVLARRNLDREIFSAHPLPDALVQAAKDVAGELGLRENWLNSAVSFHFPDFHTLPHSFWIQMETRDFGDWLRVDFIPRPGQILLKFYAALNRAEPRDFDDLKALAPDAAETTDGLHWVLRSISGLTHRDRLPDLLHFLGHDDLLRAFEK